MTKTLNKGDLVGILADRLALSQSAVDRFMSELIVVIDETLTAGDAINVRGFVKLEPAMRSARVGRNPKTGDPIEIPASRYIRAKAGSTLGVK